MTVDLVGATALAALTFILVEIALRLPFAASLSAIVRPSLRSISVMRASGVSEHWKERAMLLYAVRTLRGVTWFTANLARVAIVALGFGAVLAFVVPGFVAFSFGAAGLALTLVVAVLWVALRTRATQSHADSISDYTPLEQIMHRVALGNDAIAEMSFSLDQKLWRGDVEVARTGEHVFVAGLARAGTTALTRALQDSGDFGTLTYRDMPFVLAPNLWQWLPGRSGQAIAAKERAHGDGLTVDIDSAESLEEPFWRVFDRVSYLKADRLLPHKPERSLVEKYQSYIAAVLSARRATRYLAKNNNNILRLGTLATAFPNAHLLVPFRHPLTQAASLLAQHERFCAMHDRDAFSLDYMGWLAHHEFGSDHRFFDLHSQNASDPATLDYWLAQWINAYEWLLETAPEAAHFICYEQLCNDPEMWTHLAEKLGVDCGQISPFHATRIPEPENLTPLQERAMAIYDRLGSRTLLQRVKLPQID